MHRGVEISGEKKNYIPKASNHVFVSYAEAAVVCVCGVSSEWMISSILRTEIQKESFKDRMIVSNGQWRYYALCSVSTEIPDKFTFNNGGPEF